MFFVFSGCVLHLKFTVARLRRVVARPLFTRNLFLLNETRSARAANVNHDVVGLPTTSGFVLTLTRFVTRTRRSTSGTRSARLIRVNQVVIFADEQASSLAQVNRS